MTEYLTSTQANYVAAIENLADALVTFMPADVQDLFENNEYRITHDIVAAIAALHPTFYDAMKKSELGGTDINRPGRGRS